MIDVIMETLTDRTGEYKEYLQTHISNVNRSWNEILRPSVLDDSDINLSEVDTLISMHDKSKYSDVEFIPYLNHFYPQDGSNVSDNDKDDPEFDTAWLMHIHSNPHHWQYWTLIRDSGGKLGIDIPIKYVLEMLCDWHSFSALYPESTAYKWFNDNKSKMTFSDNTLKLINKYIKVFKDNPLSPVVDDSEDD